MIHLYCGDGKGKTTAAMGLALRMAGRGHTVVIAQFLKGEDSGERFALAHVPHITLLPLPRHLKFAFQMTQEELQQEQLRNRNLLIQAVQLAKESSCKLLILDEVCPAVSLHLLSLDELLSALHSLSAEIVLTGRDPLPALQNCADYITQFQKIRHPYDSGQFAREGVEY
ncbi:MAG: cob(I)yrinic acid a,c-diamide adenosyltransferase [Lawsonibacter sp.]|jgi:cob(I)alamin adenosyltransferase